MLDELTEELCLYNLLRHLFLKEPTLEFISDIMKIKTSPEIDDDLSRGIKLMVDAANKNSHRFEAWIGELAVEYTRLFIGPVNAPAVPYESFYLSESRSLMTDETIEVRTRYLAAGLAVKGLHSIPDDHIGIELEFIYYLTKEIIEFFERGLREETAELLEKRSVFLKEHPAAWAPFFADKILEHSDEDFFKGSALILKGAVEKTQD